MTEESGSQDNLMGILTTALVLPVAICAVLGGFFMYTHDDPTQGLSLVGLAVLLGALNMFVIKFMKQKIKDE